MDESPNPGENEEPEARLGRILPSECKKRLPGAESGGRLEMLLQPYAERLRKLRKSLAGQFRRSKCLSSRRNRIHQTLAVWRLTKTHCILPIPWMELELSSKEPTVLISRKSGPEPPTSFCSVHRLHDVPVDTPLQ
jgi:hypothetical protein